MEEEDERRYWDPFIAGRPVQARSGHRSHGVYRTVAAVDLDLEILLSLTAIQEVISYSSRFIAPDICTSSRCVWNRFLGNTSLVLPFHLSYDSFTPRLTEQFLEHPPNNVSISYPFASPHIVPPRQYFCSAKRALLSFFFAITSDLISLFGPLSSASSSVTW